MNSKTIDPKGLIREAFRIEGIGQPECRTIFLDWALSRSGVDDLRPLVRQLLDEYDAEPADHPMRVVLLAALGNPPVPRRRGGRGARQR